MVAGDEGHALTTEPVSDRNFIQSLEKGLLVLQAFSAEKPRFTLAEMARETGLSRATARRVLLTLRSLGYLGTDERTYFLLPRVLELGYGYLSSAGLPGIVQPHLDVLTERIQEGCSVGVLSGDEVVYIARAHGRRIMTAHYGIGQRVDPTVTAAGRMLLAVMPPAELSAYLGAHEFRSYTEYTVSDRGRFAQVLARAREQDRVIVDQELEIGFRTAAVPIRSDDGKVVAALDTGLHATRTSVSRIEGSVIPELRSTVSQIERDLRAYVGPLVS